MKKNKKNQKFSKKKERKASAFSIICLLLNLLTLSGVGSILGGKRKEGIWQISLVIIGIILFMFPTIYLLGIIIFFVAWVWSVYTGVIIVQKSKKA